MSDLLNLSTPTVRIESIPEAARLCLQRFSEAFNSEDLSGMDEQCHFPHYLIGEHGVTVWTEPGQIPRDFFDQLKESGWSYTTCEKCEPVLCTESKIHILWSYARRRADSSLISMHENLWILVKKDDRWGVIVRSY